jgi:hypothetical protein
MVGGVLLLILMTLLRNRIRKAIAFMNVATRIMWQMPGMLVLPILGVLLMGSLAVALIFGLVGLLTMDVGALRDTSSVRTICGGDGNTVHNLLDGNTLLLIIGSLT